MRKGKPSSRVGKFFRRLPSVGPCARVSYYAR